MLWFPIRVKSPFIRYTVLRAVKFFSTCAYAKFENERKIKKIKKDLTIFSKNKCFVKFFMRFVYNVYIGVTILKRIVGFTF